MKAWRNMFGELKEKQKPAFSKGTPISWNNILYLKKIQS